MTQQTIETDLQSMDNLDFMLTANPSQPSLPSEEISKSVRYDFDTSEFFCEIDTSEVFCDMDLTDLNLAPCSDQSFEDILKAIKAVEEHFLSGSLINDSSESFKDEMGIFHSTESNDMANLIQSNDEQLAMNKSNHSALPVTRPHVGKTPTKSRLDQSISLSTSVAVTDPTPNQLQLAHPLEDTYRARYKSDYFPQNGNVRRPRYVADNAGHHCITLQMPNVYHRSFANEYVRVALITTLIDGRQHYYSPYKFQTNHDDVKTPDQNPIYIPVQAHQENGSMKLHLVLIKSKLDQLYDAQPLQPFSDTTGTIQNIISEEKIAPKDLINQYQLDRSHIAFTLCTKLPNGTYDVHPETTIISSVISESSTKPVAVSNNKSKSVEKPAGKSVSCPHCKHCFDPTNVNVTESRTKRKERNQTSRTVTKNTINNRTAKKKKTV